MQQILKYYLNKERIARIRSIGCHLFVAVNASNAVWQAIESANIEFFLFQMKKYIFI